MPTEENPFQSVKFHEKCRQRAMLLEQHFIRFRDKLYSRLMDEGVIKHASGLTLNATVLGYCMDRYFKDIEAERVRHATDKLFNGYRQAIYTMKWLTKLRPIITATAVPQFIMANDEFAYEIGMAMLRCNPDRDDGTFRKFLVYSLRHGDFSPELMLAMCALLNPDLPKEQHPASA